MTPLPERQVAGTIFHESETHEPVRGRLCPGLSGCVWPCNGNSRVRAAVGRVRVHGGGTGLGQWRGSATCRQRTGRCRSKRTVCFSAQQTGESRWYTRPRQLCVCTAPRGARSGAMSTAHPRRIAVPSEGRSGRPQANLAPGLLSRRSARARHARAVVRGDGSGMVVLGRTGTAVRVRGGASASLARTGRRGAR